MKRARNWKGRYWKLFCNFPFACLAFLSHLYEHWWKWVRQWKNARIGKTSQHLRVLSPIPIYSAVMNRLCFDYWLNVSIEIIIITVTTYSRVSQVWSVRSISCRKKSPRCSSKKIQQTDIQRTDIVPYWAVPPGSPGWQLKRQNLSCLHFCFWCCWFIVSASLCACWRPARDSLKLPFLERRQFKWNLSALALTFQKKKEARISFEVSNSKWVRWGRSNSSYLLILFPWQPHPTSPWLWNEWQQATVSPFQLFGGNLNS